MSQTFANGNLSTMATFFRPRGQKKLIHPSYTLAGVFISQFQD